MISLLRRPWTLNLSPGRPEYTCSAVKMTSGSNVGNDMNKSRRVRLNGSNYTRLLYGAVFRHNGIPGENWFQNNNLVVHMCDYVMIIQS